MDYLIYFKPIFYAVSIIFLVALLSGALVRKGVITELDIKSLSHITIYLLLPCLIFSKIIQSFKPAEFTYWWLMPLLAFAMIGLGILIASLLYIGKIKENKANIAIAAFMNANYMVLPIGQLAFPEQFDLFTTYVFLFVLGVNPALWSLGKYMITSSNGTKLNVRGLLTPPFVANIIAVLIVLIGVHKFIPDYFMKPIDFIGSAAIPVATIVLGATIGSISLKKIPPIFDIIKVVSTKLILLPLLVILILINTKLPQINLLLADLLVIQASVAPATQIIIQAKKYGGNVQHIGGMMFVTYCICMLTIPMWFTFWKYLLENFN
ncbi:MAG: AEC family transporter [Salinivirgaceae bacterium]|nr:AEC family transporter [Salinivirgaceae bacterium]